MTHAPMARGERDALIAWSSIAEPGDVAAGALVGALGAARSLEWVADGRERLAQVAAELAEISGPNVARAAAVAHERWLARLDRADEPHERRTVSVGGSIVTRGEPEWPSAVSDLGDTEPFALYVRGDRRVLTEWDRSVAIVGSRSATSYGAYVAAEIADGVAGAGRAVISGGAYGIDAAAHRAALAHDGATIAVMAGGVDRLYPVGNDELLRSIVATGAVVSEVPPGFAPHRSRFLSRNRLIACAKATVVVEAASRSGALSTARHAADLLRPVGAVPGPVTSASSSGCHAMVRDGVAVLVTGADEVLELAAALTDPVVAESALVGPGAPAQAAIEFGSLSERRMFDVLTRRARTVESAAAAAGLSLGEARTALGALEGACMVERHRSGWRRSLASRTVENGQ